MNQACFSPNANLHDQNKHVGCTLLPDNFGLQISPRKNCGARIKTFHSMLASIFLFALKINAQDPGSNVEYKIPENFQFNYKVVYEVNDENKNTNRTMTYFFTNSGDYMGMQTPKEEKENSEFMIHTKDGKMLMFNEEHASGNQKNPQKMLIIMDMRKMMKGMGDVAKSLPKNGKKQEPEKQETLDNFKKTGKTKQIAGYTAEEYEKTIADEDKNGKMRSGTMSIWYAKVDFDPSMMFSLGMGSLSGSGATSKSQLSQKNNMIGLGLTEKNYLLMEIDFSETSGKKGTGMKIQSISKTSFTQGTSGYQVRNMANMGLKEMMTKQE
jgi:hypothetical protein